MRWSGASPTVWVLCGLTGLLILAQLLHDRLGVGDAPYLLAVGAATLVAWAGALSRPRGGRLLPVLVSSGLTCSCLGDLVYDLVVGPASASEITAADVCYYASYVAIGAALAVTVVRHPDRRGVDVDAALDALTVVVVVVMVAWGSSAQAFLSGADRSLAYRIVLAGYPLVDAVLLAMVLRVMSVRRLRGHLGWGFALGISCWLCADFGYLLSDSTTLWAVLDVGYMAGAALMTSVAWRRVPSPTPAPTSSASSPNGQLGIAILPLLVPPALLLDNRFVGRHVGMDAAVLGLVALIAIAFVRSSRLFHRQRQVQAELGSARDAALDASRAKSAFLATMSHEIRTPMNGVIGLTDLLLGSTLDQRQRQYAEGVRGAGHALLAIINDILDFSKIEAGHLELETIDFDLLEVVEGVAGLVAESAQTKGLELMAYCSPELPTELRGDPTRLRQVLLNLVGNAIKFTASGEIVVRAGLASLDGDAVVVRIEVSDTGIGIAPEARADLFAPFSQADSSTTRRFGGTGLGLAICRQLVDAMDGTLGVDSRPGAGSTFWFTVPLRLADRASADPDVTGRLSGRRALVVDDNQTNRTILRDQLHRWGMRVDPVSSGSAALARLARVAPAGGTTYDVVLLDLCLPDGDGLDLARRIAASPGMPALPVVLMTSGPEVTPADLARSEVAAALTKPVPMSLLSQVLATLLQAAPAPDREVATPARTSTAVPGPAEDLGQVLVVDDSEINQLVATGMLARLGYRVVRADDGAAALEELRQGRFDAVLMDVEMPGMDGYQATAEIRRLGLGGPRLPVIAMTAGAAGAAGDATGDRDRALAAGMDDYLTKPFTADVLRVVLQRWVAAATTG